MKNIQKSIIYFAALLVALILVGCGSNPVPSTPLPATPKTTATPRLTASPQPPTDTPTPDFELTLTADALTNPPPTPTGTPVVDVDGNVTWHPQKVLVGWSNGGADGSSFQDQSFALFWDGTLLQSNGFNSPYITKLNQDEICKILNTVNASNFFEEIEGYNFPFAGAASSYISVNGWKSNTNGAQYLWGAIAGLPYYDKTFCRDCPIPWASTIIRPGLANVYYFLQNYIPEKRQVFAPSKILVRIYPSEKEATGPWPLTSLTLDQFIEKCGYCDNMGQGAIFDGVAAQEIMQKFHNGDIIKRSFYGGSPSISITYEAIWPDAPDVPANATLTCNTKGPAYPILPLNPKNKFWYYAPDGKWGAELVDGQNTIRVVNTSGYEKNYQYNATFFGQQSIQIYPRYWSADGRFFYVNILPGDYKPNVSLVNSIGLQQIDVKNEKVKYVFLGAQGQTFAYQFSPDAKKVAYIRQGDQPLKLVIVDVYSGEEQSVSLITPEGASYSSAGTLFWSPKNDKIFLSADYADDGQQKGRVLSVHLNQLADLHILKQDDSLLRLRDTYTDNNVEICGAEVSEDTFCKTRLYLDTEEIK